MEIEILKEQKKKLKMTNADLARLSGVSLGTINKIFSGATRAPQIDTMRAILKVLRIESRFTGRLHTEARSCEYQLMEDETDTVWKKENRVQTKAETAMVEKIRGRLHFVKEPDWNHQQILLEAAAQIRQYLLELRRHTKEGKLKYGEMEQNRYYASFGPIPVCLDSEGDTVLYPDLILVGSREKIQDNMVWGAPDFVLEVVTDSDQGYTYVEKMRMYLQAGVKEYWIMEGNREKILTIWNGGNAPQIREYTFLEKVPVRLLKGLTVSMAWTELQN